MALRCQRDGLQQIVLRMAERDNTLESALCSHSICWVACPWKYFCLQSVFAQIDLEVAFLFNLDGREVFVSSAVELWQATWSQRWHHTTSRNAVFRTNKTSE